MIRLLPSARIAGLARAAGAVGRGLRVGELNCWDVVRGRKGSGMSWGSVRALERAPRRVGVVMHAEAARAARLVGRGLRGAETHRWGVSRGCGSLGVVCEGIRVLGKSPRRDFLVVRAGAARADRLAVRARSCVLPLVVAVGEQNSDQ